jgi:hypothetical protein
MSLQVLISLVLGAWLTAPDDVRDGLILEAA